MCSGNRSEQEVKTALSAPGMAVVDMAEPAANTAPLDPTRYLDLVHKVARRMARSLPRHVCYDDLVGAGTVGLLEAATRFDPARGRFEAFAEFRIKGAILDELRRYDMMGRNARLRRKRIDQTDTELTARLGRPPTEREMARAMDMNVSGYRQVQTKTHRLEINSIDARTSDGHGGTRPGLELVSPEPSVETAVADRELHEQLHSVLAELPARRRSIVEMYYQGGMTLKAIGEQLGVSESRVCQILGETTRKLKGRLEQRGTDSMVA